MKSVHLFALCIAACIAVAAPVSAKSSPASLPLTIKLGGFVFASGNTTTGNGTGFGSAIGLDYILHRWTPTNPEVLSAYLDSFDRIVGGGIAVRTHGAGYVGAGVGYYSISITPGTGCLLGCPGIGLPPSSYDGSTYTTSGVGGKLFAGLRIGRRVQIEGSYNVLPSVIGLSTTNVGLTLGVRL